jgi:molybdenum cofactor synthesis domain-containing protein
MTGNIFELIAVGNELLIGKTLNTNIHWIAGEVTKLGGFVRRATVVRDDLNEISNANREALQRKSDWIIVTGGLGPTFDDMTLQGVATALNRKLVLNSNGLEYLRRSYERFRAQGVLKSYELTKERKKMVMMPARSKALPNSIGTAPGVVLRAGKSIVVCLPGVPAEMQAIMKESVMPEISKKIGSHYFCEGVLKVSNAIESNIAPFIKEVMAANPSAYIKSHPRGIVEGESRIELSITTTAPNKSAAQKIIKKTLDQMEQKVKKIGGAIILKKVC